VIKPDRLCLFTIFLLLPLARAQEPEGLIHLDFIVTDPTGKPVSGLKAADFAVLDNGQPEKIVSFHAYDGLSAKADPPARIILVLDMLEAPELASQVRDSARAFLRENGGHLAQPTSVLLITKTGLSRVGLSPTDGNALAESITNDRETPWNPAKGNLSTQIDHTWEASQAPYLGPGNPWYAPPGATGGPKKLDPSAEAALQALGMIATTQRRQPGRKLLIWLGPGWGMGSGNNPNEKDGSGHLKEKEVIEQKQLLFDKIVWLSTLLRLARVSVYSFSVGEKNLIGFPSLASYVAVTLPAQATVFDLNRKMLAIESGGRVLKPSTDLAHQIDDCVREANAFYTLSFDPAPAVNPDEYHDLKVVLHQLGMTVRTNAGYYDEPYYSDAPNLALRRLTVAQLTQWMHDAQGESDGELAKQLSILELTERANTAEIASWTTELHSKKAREALLALVDASAFLDPPAAYVLPDPPPDENAQREMVSLATEYLNNTIPRLPNFFARRTAISYEEIPPFYQGIGRFTAAQPLHAVNTSKTTVLYRSGAEVEAKSPQANKQDRYLTTYGTFGPVLGAVKGALANSVTWSRWEKDASGERRAVFRFAVPAAASRYRTGGCCLPDREGNMGFGTSTAYHGQIAIDPASGAVLRILVQADLKGFVPLNRSGVIVTYAPVVIGGKTYICPIHSVSLLRARSVNALREWDTQEFLTWGPYATELNDFRYDDYRMFRGESRMLSGFDVTPQ
jgi:VWFA-related protein